MPRLFRLLLYGWDRVFLLPWSSCPCPPEAIQLVLLWQKATLFFSRCCLPSWNFHHASICLQRFLFPPAAKTVSQQPCPQGMNCQKGLWLQLSVWKLILTLPAQAQTSKSLSFHEEQIPLASTLWLSPWPMAPQSFLLQVGISQHSILCPSAGRRENHLSACY